jgi:hypothetical protein
MIREVAEKLPEGLGGGDRERRRWREEMGERQEGRVCARRGDIGRERTERAGGK